MDLETIKFVILQGGFALCAFAAWYWGKGNNEERKQAQAALNELGKRSIEADFTVAKSMDGLAVSINTLVGSISDSQRR